MTSMEGFLNVLSLLTGVLLILSLYRVLAGPTVFDRLAGLGLIGTKTVVLLVFVGIIQGRSELFVDITLAIH